MQTFILKKQLRRFVITAVVITAVLLPAATLVSFTARSMADGFLQQLGISKTDADKKISNSILGGYLDAYGVKNLKNIAAGNKTAVAKDLLNYTKKQLSSPAFIKEYNEQRNNSKPQPDNIEKPEEVRQRMISDYKKGIQDIEKMLATADAATKTSFEKMVTDSKKRLAEAEDVNSKTNQQLRKSYEDQLQYGKAAFDKRIADWETQYPSNPQLFIKKRLEQFMTETANIDFDAATTVKNGKRVFTDAAYERKSNRWKMAYRAGKEVVETARTFVQQWLTEIQ